MTEISYESPYYVTAGGTKPAKPIQDEYHPVIPPIQTNVVVNSVVPNGYKTDVAGYDCTQAKGGPH
ncbi:MAG: hypothetical protein G01um10147_1110 [Microgenomates group bacterium Gr01-1014_7]|nr:MAG: hypothetical protein G01um10147_1110 [Microgenomates group bacterium Gr01-1014_7]